jgi:hypothetical protein
MKVGKEQVIELVARWQAILRLRDWNIDVHIVNQVWRKSGDIKVDDPNKMAVLMVNQTPVCDNLEEIVVHELLHLRLYGLSQMLEHLIGGMFDKNDDDPRREFAMSQYYTLLEPTVQDLTKSLLSLGGQGESPSWARVRKMVSDEVTPAQPPTRRARS